MNESNQNESLYESIDNYVSTRDYQGLLNMVTNQYISRLPGNLDEEGEENENI